MKKVLSILFIGVAAFAEDNDVVDYSEDNDSFIELSEPSKYISGAFWGIGGGPSFISHKLNAHNETANQDRHVKKSAVQYDLAFLFGFGTLFYRDYYAGINFEIMQRFGKGKSYDEDLGFKFSSQFGINMDVRFGYLFPQQGNLLYTSVGFTRTLGKVLFKGTGQNTEIGFGSYFPTFGLGFEHKINHLWNAGICAKYSITSKDSKDNIAGGGQKWSYKAKPWVTIFKFYVTRNI